MTTEALRIHEGFQAESERIPGVREDKTRQDKTETREVEVRAAPHQSHPQLVDKHADGHPVLAEHVGCRLHALDDRTLRCVDHAHTLDIRIRASTARSTSTSSQPLRLNDPLACSRHVGQSASNCGPCRSERLAGDR